MVIPQNNGAFFQNSSGKLTDVASAKSDNLSDFATRLKKVEVAHVMEASTELARAAFPSWSSTQLRK